jgi:signal transduction histidine kinase
VVLRTINYLLKGTNVNLVIDFPTNLYPAAIDEAQIKQVISNLTANAIEAMPKGGTFTVRGENLHVSAQDNVPMREGHYLKISISDTGAGIPAENVVKIFDPYYSTKDTYSQKGLGLGLAVCYSIITKHEGLITVDSEVGKGTTFTIYLPAAR